MSESDTTNQAEYSKDLADYLTEEVFAGTGYCLTAADVLDALASMGLKMVEDIGGDAAATAYAFHLSEGTIPSGDIR